MKSSAQHQPSPKWWDDATVANTVTASFVASKLADPSKLATAIDRSHQTVASMVYLDYLVQKAPRLFLLLADTGLASSIFAFIDDGWTDAMFPLWSTTGTGQTTGQTTTGQTTTGQTTTGQTTTGQTTTGQTTTGQTTTGTGMETSITEMSGTTTTTTSTDSLARLARLVPNEKARAKLLQRQFEYFIRFPAEGGHVDYHRGEKIPIESLDRQPWLDRSLVQKVRLGNDAHTLYWCRRLPFTGSQEEDAMRREDFLELMEALKGDPGRNCCHLVTCWASFTHGTSGYILFRGAGPSTLKGFLTAPPSAFKRMGTKASRLLILQWMYCLSDTLVLLHEQYKSHSYLKPSTVHLTADLVPVICDSSPLGPESVLRKAQASSLDLEWYDYSAPEHWASSTGPSYYFGTMLASQSDSYSFGAGPMSQAPNPYLDEQASDVFSLGCILLDLMSFLLKKQTKFTAHRAGKQKSNRRGGSVPDSSFHHNLNQVESWMAELARDASVMATRIEEEDEEEEEGGGGQERVEHGGVEHGGVQDAGVSVFYTFTPLLHLITGMLSVEPADRPTAEFVRNQIREIVSQTCPLHLAQHHEPLQRVGRGDRGVDYCAVRLRAWTSRGGSRASSMSGSSRTASQSGSHEQWNGSTGTPPSSASHGGNSVCSPRSLTPSSSLSSRTSRRGSTEYDGRGSPNHEDRDSHEQGQGQGHGRVRWPTGTFWRFGSVRRGSSVESR